MTNNQRAIFIYLPVLLLTFLVIYRFDHNRVYTGSIINSLPEGHYSLLKIKCLDAGLEFNYQKPASQNPLNSEKTVRDMLFYNGELERKIIILNEKFTWVVGNKSCFVYSQTKIRENAQGDLRKAKSQRTSLIPDNCKLEYSFNNSSFIDNSLKTDSDNEILHDDDTTSTYKVYKDGDQYLLYEAASSDYSEYGCGSSDRFVLSLKKAL